MKVQRRWFIAGLAVPVLGLVGLTGCNTGDAAGGSTGGFNEAAAERACNAMDADAGDGLCVDGLRAMCLGPLNTTVRQFQSLSPDTAALGLDILDTVCPDRADEVRGRV